jgi:pimeloyl-ACP methyl ester carboxylesterase
MTEGTVQVEEGVELFYRDSGGGSRIVLVPNGFYFEDLVGEAAAGRRVVIYDVRNRGRSGTVADEARLARGIQNDVDDLEAMRRHLDAGEVDLLGHSYIGVVLLLYALKYPQHVGRIAAIGTPGPRPATRYAAPLAFEDGVVESVISRVRDLEAERSRQTAEAFCRQVWAILGEIYVVNPADAHKAFWGRCELPNERAAMAYWMRYIQPSLNAVAFTDAELQQITAPVLILHGRKDRSAPFGGGRDWADRLPNARFEALDDAGHAPWIEAPDRVASTLRDFFAING